MDTFCPTILSVAALVVEATPFHTVVCRLGTHLAVIDRVYEVYTYRSQISNFAKPISN